VGATEWGPGHKKTASGHVMGIWSVDGLWRGKYWYADCTDGWTGRKHGDRNDAEYDHGQHFKAQHGGK
jgi:hypothetical protein